MKKCKHILYLGLDPKRYHAKGKITHFPIIEPTLYQSEDVTRHFKTLHQYTAIVLTSRAAISFFFQCATPSCHDYYVVGQGSAELLESYGIRPMMAPYPTAEGVCACLAKHPPTSVFYPHALGARPIIADWLQRHAIPHVAFAFYHTQPRKLSILLDLEPFDEIVFTSPSCVAAFLLYYGTLPMDKILTPIGPVTAQALLDKGALYQQR